MKKRQREALDYARRRWTYTFRAWIDENGYNEDRAHAQRCEMYPTLRCWHRRLWELNTRASRHLLRVTYGYRFFEVHVGKRYRRLVRIGR